MGTKDASRLTLGFFAGFIVAIGFSGRALDLEPAVGVSEFCCKSDSLWWQSTYGFNGHTRVAAFDIGARVRLGDWSIAARYSEIGNATGLNVATMRDDDFGRFDATKGCDTKTHKNCLGYFAVSQHIAGAMLGAAYGFTNHGVRVDAEIGQFFYQSEIKVAILCPNCGTGQRYSFGAGGTFTSSSEIRRSPYGALRLTYKNVTLTYRRISNVDGNGERREGLEAQFASGLTHGPVNQLLVGMSL